jgi:hypothetical protein
MDDLDILYHGEIQILGWGESRPRGKYLTIRLWDVDADPLEAFRGLDEPNDKSLHILNCTISKGDIIETVENDQPINYGKMASRLYANGFFYAPKVLEVIGTDEQYRKWIQKQPSAISGDFSEWVNDEGRCEAAHVRRSYDAGTGYKPPYSCIPLTHDEHAQQHNEGESALKPREWFDNKRNEYVVAWAKQGLLTELGHYSGFRDVPPEILLNWCESHDVTHLLPKEYRENGDK